MLALKQQAPFKAASTCRSYVRYQRSVRIAAQNQDPSAPSTSTPPAPSSPQGYKREFEAFGMKVIETADAIKGPEDEKDFWEGETFENFGKVMEQYFLPGLVVLGLICGGIAAGTYNEGADTFIKSPTGPEATAEFIPATALAQPPAAAPATTD